MSDAPLTCPYCNAQQPLHPGLAVGQKIVCARCGDAFVLEHLPAVDPSPTASQGIKTPARVPTGKPVRANRLVAALIVGVMFVMAGAGLTFALMTVDKRRDQDRVLPRKPRRLYDLVRPDPEPPDVVGPERLAGLGYLPPRTGVIIGLQVEELLASPLGKELRSGPLKIGPMDLPLDTIREWTGMEADQIDHVLVGVVLRDLPETDLTPPIHLVVRTRKPYDGKRIRVALKAESPREERTPEGKTRTIYKATVRGFPVSLWLADGQTFLVGVFSQFELVPTTPLVGPKHLSEELRQLLSQRLSAGVPLWIVGHSSDWKKTWLPPLAGQFKELPVLKRLEQVPSFAIWLIPTKPPRLQGAFRCSDENRARKIAEEDLAPLTKANAERFKYSREGAWLDVQVNPGDPPVKR